MSTFPESPTPAIRPSDSQKTAALPLALAYAALIVYASLYPFSDWRDQGIAPWAFLAAPWPRWWTAFDFVVNVVGYLPMGFLGALTVLRTRPDTASGRAWLRAGGAAAAISFGMEALQSYLPARIPSNVDFGLNAAGGFIGAGVAIALVRLGVVDQWQRARASWFVRDARGGLSLLALWPVALLFPAAVTFGLGQVFERVEESVAEWLSDTPFLDWLPVREFELEPLVPAVEMICVTLGALVPCLLVFHVSRAAARRALLLPLVMLTGVAATALSAALSFGPDHAWAWLTLPVQFGICLALVAGVLLLPISSRMAAALLLVAQVLHLSLLNQAPESAYFTQTLATWEQGRFIRFHGVAQWLGWLWPFATLGYAVLALTRRPRGSLSNRTPEGGDRAS